MKNTKLLGKRILFGVIIFLIFLVILGKKQGSKQSNNNISNEKLQKMGLDHYPTLDEMKKANKKLEKGLTK